MAEPRFELYKDALRRGHVAAFRERHDLALDAYDEASRLAPDRALPYVGIARALARLDRPTDALVACEAALDRAPTDEAALQARADLLLAIGDRARAAETLDRLTAVLDAADRLPEAVLVGVRALELAEARRRRTTVRVLLGRLRAAPIDERTGPAIETATRALGVSDDAGSLPGSPPGDDGPPAPGDGGPPAPAPDPAAIAAWASPIAPPPDPAAVLAGAALEDAIAAGDLLAVRDRALETAEGHRASGASAAAVDACYLALEAHPADPGVHLALADLYLDRGWDVLAADKLVMLARLAELDDDPVTRRRVCYGASRLPGDPRLAEICVFVAAEATALVEQALDGDDVVAIRDRALEAAAGHRANGTTAAAIDACYLALASHPADPAVHLALAELYLDQGWRIAAADKLVLLLRLSALHDDAATRERIQRLASDRMADDARLAQASA